MKQKQIAKTARKLSEPFRVTDGSRFKLKQINPQSTLWFNHADKAKAKDMLATGVESLAALQDKLYAHDRYSLLLIFQAMDAAGKDGAIEHVMSGVNPQGCQVYSFKAPSAEELDHDFLWRCARNLPNRGNIGIFNRSYYEEVLVVRVHPEILTKEKLPPESLSEVIWKERFEDIRNFERYLSRNGTVILKFFLHVSRKEQKRRFLSRLQNPDKHWKFSASDLQERAYWPDYMRAYEDMIRHTATKHAPWYVVPADNKWFTRMVVASAIIEALSKLKLAYPAVSRAQMKELAAAQETLQKG